METVTFGWIGTAIAGGFYPLVQAALGGDLFWRLTSVFDLVLHCWMAFILGFVCASMAAIAAVLAACMFAALTRIRGTPIWLASLVGGWTGFLCTVPTEIGFSDSRWFDVLLATAMGQAGAAWIAWRAVRRNRRLLGVREAPRKKTRMGLRQLFGATTAICILAAIIGAAGPTAETYRLMAGSAELQALAIIAVKVASNVRSKSARTKAESA